MEMVLGEPTNITGVLKNSASNDPISGQNITFHFGTLEMSALSDSSGRAEVSVAPNSTGKQLITAEFYGTDSYIPSKSDTSEAEIKPKICSDGTVVGQCSYDKVGYMCEEDKTLALFCSTCGCPSSLVCQNNTCITQEQETQLIVSALQDEVVFVAHTTATGSGVIIQSDSSGTVILTNKHVIEDADRIGDVSIKDNNGATAHATNIRYAPNGVDLAAIYVSGIHGEPVQVENSSVLYKGQEVLALGSPLGIQGSVSQGIISNFQDANADYPSSLIQTDAAVNPGNSGGGLFLKDNGQLIGINTYKLTSAQTNTEGLNFAIDIKELQKLGSFDSWPIFSPLPKCTDGTKYNQCSNSNAGLLCDTRGQLVPWCSICGCSSERPYCSDAGYCFSCPSSYTPYSDGGCCPGGYSYFGQGECCPPGYFDAGGACCPNGTTLSTDGTCQ